jgi:addiction module RelB/DinJ family antitoxin
MSVASTLLRTRVPVDRMGRVEEILDHLGLKPTDAVNMLFAQIERRGCLPFEVTLHHQPLMSSKEQAEQWSESFGEY